MNATFEFANDDTFINRDRDICLRFTELNCVDLEVTYPSPQRQVLNSLLINMYKYYGLSTIFLMQQIVHKSQNIRIEIQITLLFFTHSGGKTNCDIIELKRYDSALAEIFDSNHMYNMLFEYPDKRHVSVPT